MSDSPKATRLELSSFCSECGRHRSHGNHQKCSRIRQARHAHRWEAFEREQDKRK